jgi:N-acetylmuramoyl-L-alanine amidase
MLAAFGAIFRSVVVRTGAVALLGAVGLVAAVSSHAMAGAAGVQKIRLGGDRNETRIVIDLDRAATAKISEEDRRVVMTLPGVAAKESLQGGAQGVVKAWVLDQAGGAARLRIDLTADAIVKRRFLLPPADGIANYRYVIDLAARTPVAGPPAPTAQLTSLPTPKRAPLSLKKVVVIDAGHGGKDPGAQGGKTVEKDVNLAAALALKSRLERTGRYKVVLTRSDDTFVPLDVRVKIARRADADLFISLHADSGTNTELKGASVYTLPDSATGRSAKFFNRDDWFQQANLTGGDRGVSDILLDLTQRATRNRSGAFAEMLLNRVDDHAPLLRRSHREAGLVVLLAPDVPAVLLEMGFINNEADAARLRNPGKRAQLMNAVGQAIDDYFNQQTRLASR